MSQPERKLSAVEEDGAGRPAPLSVCPVTGVTIPECGCQRCATEQIRHHAPWLLDRRFGNQRRPGRAA